MLVLLDKPFGQIIDLCLVLALEVLIAEHA